MLTYLDVAVAAARKAGDIQLAGLHTALHVREETLHDIKLQTDVDCEDAIREMLLGAFPDTSILAEEGGGEIAADVPTWIDRAHYYPTAKPMVLKVISHAQTGKLLGVQAVGAGDVAKRIDVAATALSYGAMTQDLAELDLAYAPPFSSAVDLLAHAANVIDNKAKGVALAISPVELKAKLDAGDDFVMLDVRSPKEVAAMPFTDARVVNIPLGMLRTRLAELPKDKEIVTFCKISVRGYEAQRILNGEGFDNVCFLDGGLMAWPYPMTAAVTK